MTELSLLDLGLIIEQENSICPNGGYYGCRNGFCPNTTNSMSCMNTAVCTGSLDQNCYQGKPRKAKKLRSVSDTQEYG